MDFLHSELSIPRKYMQTIDGRINATVHKCWLSSLQNIGRIKFIVHERLSADEIGAQPSLDELGPNWTRIYVKVS